MFKLINKLHFALLTRIYETDKTVDEIIKKIMTLDIKKYTHDEFYIQLITENYIYKIWNSNKYYGWLSEGKILDKSGNEIYSWIHKMPSKNTMLEFKKFLESYAIKEIIHKLI